MMRKSTLKKIIRKLEKENLKLIIECNAARARAGELGEALGEEASIDWDYEWVKEPPLNG